MLRRRIFSSAMASVMALSSIAVVANAEEATNALKTKEDLEKLITEVYGDSYRSADIYEYGSRCAERMLDALEHADNVLEMAKADEATEYECTTAYDMVLAVRAQMIQRTAEELATLLAQCKKIYETDNINNEELGDLIYTPESFQTFEDAYEEAESVLDSSDLRIITDAWIDLTEAKANLAPYKAVTKSAFTAAIKTMEKALDKEKAYDQWRRGTNNHNVDPLWFGWYFSTGVTYGEMFDQLKNLLPYIYTKYDEFVEVKTADKTTLDDIRMAYALAVEVAGQINTWQADETKKARKADVQKLLNEYHGRLVYDFAATDAINLFQAVAIVAGLDNIELEVRKGLYETEFVAWNDIAAFDGLTTDDIADLDKDALFITEWGGGKLMSATLRFRILPKKEGGKDIYFLFNEDGIVTGVAEEVPAEGDYKKIAAGVKCDLADYVYVYPEYVDGTFADITDGAMAFVDDHTSNGWHDADWWSGVNGAFGKDGTIGDFMTNFIANPYGGDPTSELGFDNFTALGDALPLAYEYLAEIYAGIHAPNIDTIGQIAAGTEKGSAAEWTIVHRALKYALEDRYGGSYCKHTKKDIKELIEMSYDLEEKTSQAAIFADSLEDMVAAREYVREWVKEADADKKYKDNISAYDEIPTAGVGNYIGIDGMEYADQVYHWFLAYYTDLENDWKAFKYSYGEIYNYISEVEEMIDANDITETEELRTLILNTAYYMSIVEEPYYETNDNVELDNDSYTEDRYLLAHNRVYTWTEPSYDITITDKAVTVYNSNFHSDLKNAYEALVAAVDAQLNPAVLVGDVNGDGKVFSDDAAAILKKIAAGEAAQLPLWDYNNDGAGNSADAAKILKDVAAGILK